MGHWMDIVLQLVITALITGYCSGYVLDFSSFLQISTSSSLKQLLLLLGAPSDRSSEVTIYLRDSIKMKNTPLFLLSQLCSPDRASTSLIYISRIFSIHKVTGIDENHTCSNFFNITRTIIVTFNTFFFNCYPGPWCHITWHWVLEPHTRSSGKYYPTISILGIP